MKEKYKYFLVGLILVILYLIGLKFSDTRLTYLEYTTINDKHETYISLNKNKDELKQEFIMPYDIFDSISIQIGTYQRDNNSTWVFSLFDPSDKMLYEDTFNASGIQDNGYYRHKIDKKLNVKKGEKYSFSITAQDVNELSKLAFCVSMESKFESAILTMNGDTINNTLCFRVYGGDRDYWWHGYVTFIVLYILVIIYRLYFNEKRKRNVRNDKIIQGLILGVLTFLLLCSFATCEEFIDELDNMRGGLVIANGGILYKDYITQHTPVMYYLCSIFAVLGARSSEQFRLLYFIFQSIIWTILYIRHKDYFGEKKMVLLPLLEVICITSVVYPQGYQILSDGFQGLMFTVLMLEFLRYYKDRHLNWDRSVIISICLWGSFGVAFISVYSLIFLALIFLWIEVVYFKTNKIGIRYIIFRYYKLFISLIIPFILVVIYFQVNGALQLAFEQFYTFNREVYPKYNGGIGEKISQPFVIAMQNFFNIIADNFNLVIQASATNINTLQLILMILAVVILVKLFEKKRFIESLSVGLMMIFGAIRGYGFHGLAAWYLVILLIVIYVDLLKENLKRIGPPLLGICVIILTSTYVGMVGNNILCEQKSISEIESKVIELTEKDKEQDIFLDAYWCDSLYLFYKDRKPINPAVYMLPWYMDWYEQLNVEALLEEQPSVVVYNQDRETYGITHYTNVFDNELKNHYTRMGDSGWQYSVWIKTE